MDMKKIKGWTVQDLFFSNYLLLQIFEIFYVIFSLIDWIILYMIHLVLLHYSTEETVNFINSSSPSRTTCILAVCLLTNSSIWWFASGNKSLPCHRWRCLLWLLIYSCYSLLLSYYTVGHIFKFLGQVCSFQPPF